MGKDKQNILFLILFFEISILVFCIGNYIYQASKLTNSGFFLGDVEETY